MNERPSYYRITIIGTTRPETTRVPEPEEEPTLTIKGRYTASYDMLLSQTLQIPLQLQNARETTFITPFVSDVNSLDIQIVDGTLNITARKQGTVVLRLLVNDSIVPMITGDPEIDNPVEITINVY